MTKKISYDNLSSAGKVLRKFEKKYSSKSTKEEVEQLLLSEIKSRQKRLRPEIWKE